MAAGEGSLILIVAIILGLGVFAQVLADRFRVPSVLFLILTGILVGPEFLGIVSIDSFGSGLSAIVGLSVAIIMFEAAFHLRIETFREAPSTTFRLVTIGGVIALLGTALAVHVFLDASWDISFLIGALLVATGPTVITPILQIVPVRDRVAAAMEAEGVTNDVTAAVLTVAVFEFVISPGQAPTDILSLFVGKLGTGLLVGLLVAGIIWYLLVHVDLSLDNAPQNARLIVLVGALISYSVANELASEAGIAAAVTAGVILGNADLPYESDIEDFKGDVSLVVLSFVFITLGALIEFESLLALSFGGIAVVLVVALVIRPLIVFVSTAGGRISFREKLWMIAVSPRGIIPASVATLFALELQTLGFERASTLLAGTVFLVILATVVFEGGTARHTAELLDIIPMRVLIIGGGTVGRTLATRLEDRGENVVIIENDESQLQAARNEGHTVHRGDGTDTGVLEAAGGDNAKIVVAATGDDDVNLLVSQLAASKFEPETILARANNPENVEAFEELGVRTVASTFATAQAMDNYIERPALANWMGELGRSGDVQEIEVTAEEFAGRTIRDIGPELPGGSIIALVARDGEAVVPSAEFTIQTGDRVTLIGNREDVRETMDQFHPR